MTALPNVPRWDIDGFMRAMLASDDGEYVLHADHVAAVAEAERLANLDLADESAAQYEKGVADERARIKALIASLEYDGDYCKVLHTCDLLAAIDSVPR